MSSNQKLIMAQVLIKQGKINIQNREMIAQIMDLLEATSISKHASWKDISMNVLQAMDNVADLQSELLDILDEVMADE